MSLITEIIDKQLKIIDNLIKIDSDIVALLKPINNANYETYKLDVYENTGLFDTIKNNESQLGKLSNQILYTVYCFKNNLLPVDNNTSVTSNVSKKYVQRLNSVNDLLVDIIIDYDSTLETISKDKLDSNEANPSQGLLRDKLDEISILEFIITDITKNIKSLKSIFSLVEPTINVVNKPMEISDDMIKKLKEISDKKITQPFDWPTLPMYPPYEPSNVIDGINETISEDDCYEDCHVEILENVLLKLKCG